MISLTFCFMCILLVCVFMLLYLPLPSHLEGLRKVSTSTARIFIMCGRAFICFSLSEG